MEQVKISDYKIRKIEIPVYLLYGLLIAILSISVIFYFAMQDGDKCISNPLIYGANKAITIDSGDLMCSCSFSNPSYAPFYFNKENMSIDRDFIS